MTLHQADDNSRSAQEAINALAKGHPPLAQDKLDRHLLRLERMSTFYDEKAEVVPEKQSMMFIGFVGALAYAMKAIRMYSSLTRNISKLAKEEDK